MAKTRGPKVKVTVASCYLFTNIGPMTCPVCGVTVPANTEHRCEKKS